MLFWRANSNLLPFFFNFSFHFCSFANILRLVLSVPDMKPINTLLLQHSIGSCTHEHQCDRNPRSWRGGVSSPTGPEVSSPTEAGKDDFFLLHFKVWVKLRQKNTNIRNSVSKYANTAMKNTYLGGWIEEFKCKIALKNTRVGLSSQVSLGCQITNLAYTLEFMFENRTSQCCS